VRGIITRSDLLSGQLEQRFSGAPEEASQPLLSGALGGGGGYGAGGPGAGANGSGGAPHDGGGGRAEQQHAGQQPRQQAGGDAWGDGSGSAGSWGAGWAEEEEEHDPSMMWVGGLQAGRGGSEVLQTCMVCMHEMLHAARHAPHVLTTTLQPLSPTHTHTCTGLGGSLLCATT